MANASDKGFGMTLGGVVDVIKGEREYQYKLWGYRQPDGTYKEAEHDVCDYLVYCRHYLRKAMADSSEKATLTPTLEQLRKVATLIVACLEQRGHKLDEVVKEIAEMIEEYSTIPVVNYLMLELEVIFLDASDIVVDPGEDVSVEEPLRAALAACIATFMKFGVPTRHFPDPLINRRDNLSA